MDFEKRDTTSLLFEFFFFISIFLISQGHHYPKFLELKKLTCESCGFNLVLNDIIDSPFGWKFDFDAVLHGLILLRRNNFTFFSPQKTVLTSSYLKF